MKRKAKALTVVFLLIGSHIVSAVLAGVIGVANFYLLDFCKNSEYNILAVIMKRELNWAE